MPTARVWSTLGHGPVMVVTTPAAIAEHGDRARAIERAGGELLPIETGALLDALTALASREVTSVIVEGGPTLQRAAWSSGVVDALHLYIAPFQLGSLGVPWLDTETLSLTAFPDRTVTPLGPDVLIEGYVHRVD
jgi:diaminohydroxyphosphoribosylaminopyrimidine deaminase/5-amino-6-(5-phosphoribosylamino)uracil reductase